MKSSDPPAFLDTSVVVRYLTGDTPVLSNRAAEIIDSLGLTNFSAIHGRDPCPYDTLPL